MSPLLSAFVRTLHAAEAGPKATWTLSEATGIKGMLSMILASLTVYLLHTGRRDNDINRLFLAAVAGILTFLVFLL